MPQSAATASNSRPTLVVSGDARPLCASAATCRHASGSTASASAGGRSGGESHAAASHAHAIRHGWRIAASPPGSRTGSRCPTRSKPARSPSSSSPPQTRAVAAEAGAVVDRPDRRAALAVLGETGGQVRVVVLHADELARPRARARTCVERYSGCRSCATTAGLHREQALEVLDALA